MDTTLAPTTPVAAASSVPTRTTAKARPPRKRPNKAPMLRSRSSASRLFSSTAPIRMKLGSARSTWLPRMPITRSGKALSKPSSKMPPATPITAKMSALPPTLKATG